MRRVIIFLLISVMLTSSAYAVSIGISPGRLRFEDVLREGYAERTLKITTSSEELMNGHFKVMGDIKDWLTFEPNSTDFQVSKSSPYNLKVKISPPADVRTGAYKGSIEFITDSVGNIAGRAGGVIKTAVIMMIDSEVTGEEIIECRAGAFSINDVEEGFPLEVSLNVINDGNVRLRPTVSLKIWDQMQEKIVMTEEFLADEVLPTTEDKTLKRIPHDLKVGQYWAEIRAEECNAESFITFSVVERGAIVDKGYLKDILHKAWVYVGETVEFIAKFSNSGERSVNAKFKGTIRKDDQIVKVIETEEIIVTSGEMGDFPIYFTPEEPGRYELTGRVVYNQKLTFEKGAVLNVIVPEQLEKEKFTIIPLIIYIIIIITILFILRKIHKEQKKKRRKF